MMSTTARASEDIYIDRQAGRQAGRKAGRTEKSTELGKGHDIGWRTWGGGSFSLFCPQHRKHQDIAKLRIVTSLVECTRHAATVVMARLYVFTHRLKQREKLPIQFSRVEKRAPPTVCYHHNSCIPHKSSQYHATCVAMGVGAVVHTLRCCQYDRLSGMATLIILRSKTAIHHENGTI